MKKIIFVIILLICMSNNVYANSGPWRFEPAPSFNAVPLKSNFVEVLSEDLSFDITADKTPYQATITAKYILQNVSDKSETYSIAFPYIGGELNEWDKQNKYFHTKVVFNKKQIIPQIKLIPDLLFGASDSSGIYSKEQNDNLTFTDILKHMKSAIDAKDFDITKYVDRDPSGELINIAYKREIVVLILFDIEMPANSKNELSVTYNQSAGLDRHKTKSYTYIYDYFLEPAKYWKSFKDLSITVKIPKGYKITKSSLALSETKDKKGIYRGYFETIPKENFQFQVYKSLNIAQKAYEALEMKLQLKAIIIGITFLMIAGLPFLIVVFILVVLFKKKAKV